ncbi:MAG TPA: hypothetical protein VK603_24075 [Candidatus Saccharimonadales bacterium]|nr:hypothetical protein [Candidatus Saccharimonadales bacterium]
MTKKIGCYLGLLLVWTLWTRTQTATTDTWGSASGLASQEKCQASMKDKLDMWRQFKDAKFAGNSVTFTNNKSSMTYLCLPDSEDPRKTPPKPPAKTQKP